MSAPPAPPPDAPRDPLLRRPRAPVRVDCHTHLFPERLFAAIRRWFDGAGWRIPYPYRTAEVLAQLRGFGVEQVWALTYAHRPGVAAGVNRWLGGLAAREPLVRGFFSVHPEDDDPAALAREALDRHGLSGLKLHAEVQKLAVDDRRLDPVFDLLQERGVPCLLHSGDAPYPRPMPHLSWRRVEARLRRNPRLVAVVAHLGANQTEHYLRLCDEYPGLHLDTSFALFPGANIQKTIDFERLKTYRHRLLFGSDFPNLTFGYADQADRWWELSWVRQDAEGFFGGRARDLLRGESGGR